ncbi:uncharacterized protein BCR38DRAFT_223593 [Pseudomassariella vexata]|uniref:Uncharacterized protein n=1 Tax=Pseudomassariella vexata TaxID=1141098 RepID=A0A1Y2DV78_9PEZI|nr:uncharacterized protein BCR38DRAFT_223593 [Pseudomassariella vexata]ORY63192.1 hypothetical protein BCR38DRAFT_223593 [Pseudomassariella vexata]
MIRQLQRPFTRLVPAAWRATPIASLHGSSRLQIAPCRSKSAGETSKPKSLFEELFPAEAKQLQCEGSSGEKTRFSPDEISADSAWVSQLLEASPPSETGPLRVPNDDLITYLDPKVRDTNRHARAMLVLSAASKCLAESDFFRLSDNKAEHVEGWVRGITKIIPARDCHTLEPLGHYYILFESEAAAHAYREEVRRIWELSKANATPGGPLSFRNVGPGSKESIGNFTLVPPSQRWDLEMARYTREEILLEHSGSIVDKLMDKAGTRALVLVSLDGGGIPPSTLRTAIKEDGVDRNLAWRVKDLDGQGIMSFGRSMPTSREPDPSERNSEEQRRRVMEAEEDREDNPDDPVSNTSTLNREHRSYSRFIVPFLDEAEARRFVRNWHRRHLTLCADTKEAEVDTWHKTRTLNVSLLW